MGLERRAIAFWGRTASVHSIEGCAEFSGRLEQDRVTDSSDIAKGFKHLHCIVLLVIVGSPMWVVESA